MALDGLVLHELTNELQKLAGGRISKIHQPSENDIVMLVRAQNSNFKLLLSANPTYPRVHITEQSFINPPEAPMFCMLLRKHCEGGIIERIEQVGMERILHFSIRHRDELGDLTLKTIVVEIMGRHSNLILMDPNTGNILDGIHHVTPAISGHRIVMPGSSYTPPPEQHKQNPLEIEKQHFSDLFHDAQLAGDKASSAIVQHFSGVSPLVAQEIVYRSGQPLDVTLQEVDQDKLWSAFSEAMEAIRHHCIHPNIVVSASRSGKSVFSVMQLTHFQGEESTYSSVSECLEAYYGDKAERDTIKQRVSDLLRFLQNEKSKNIKKLDKLKETLEDAKDADRFRILGELLTASMHAFRKGDKEVEVINYYDENQAMVKVQLDPLLSPSENSQRYFKKYTKAKNSLIAVQEQMDNARKEIVYLDSLLGQLEHVSMSDVEEIREELMEQGYIRDRNKKSRKKKKNDKPTLACYTSSEGVPIYVGKNNTQNEYLTTRLAHSTDTWLHTKDMPGSHVVIRSGEYGEPTLLEAAMLAAYYSQGRESSSVPVDTTLIRHVRKPNGAKPGFVIYDHQKTLFVTPNPDLIKELKVTAK